MSDLSPTLKRIKKYTYFIGIDISRNKLDFAVFHEKVFLFHAEIKNEKKAILALVARLKEIPAFRLSQAVFCMENTGFYGNHVLNTLAKLKANIVHEHALKIKRSMGMSRGKDDKIDAIRIADYAWKNRTELKLWRPKRAILTELADLMALRNRLLGVAVILKTPQKEKKNFIKITAHRKTAGICEASIKAINTDLLEIEKEIKSMISTDEYLARLMQLITSVPFVGFITAINIIILEIPVQLTTQFRYKLTTGSGAN
jgi:transposase